MQIHGLLVAGLVLAFSGTPRAQTFSASQEILQAADLERATVQRLELPAEPGQPFSVDVRLLGGTYTLHLEPHSVRADGFRVIVQDADGSYRAVEPAPVATYRGHVEGALESVVAGSLVDGGLRAIVRLAPDLPLQGIQPARELQAGAAPADHLVYGADDVAPLDVFCGTDLLDVQQQPAAGGGTLQGGGLKECELAADADFELYQSNGSSVVATENDIENIVNDVSAIYQADAGLVFKLTAIIVRTSEPDPYSTNGASSLLNQFTNHWQGSQGAIQRDIAHLFTGKNLSGSTIGIAWLNSVCGNNNGYGVSQTKFSGNMISRVALTAHEIGHNFAAGHCNGASGCAIMCSGLGGCSGILTSFYNGSINAITNKIASSGCLDDVSPTDPPVVTSVSPTVIGAFNDGDLTISGSNFGDVVGVSIGGEPMPDLKIAASFSTITVTNPVVKEAGLQEVTVETSAGVGGGHFVLIQEETGIQLEAPGLSIPGTSYLLPWSGGSDNFYTVSWSFDGGTSPVGGLDLLTNGNVGLSGTFGSAGTDYFLIPSVGSLGFVTLFFQALVIDPVSGTALGATAVGQTLFL